MQKVLDAPRPGGRHVAVGPPPLCKQECCPQHLHWNKAGGPPMHSQPCRDVRMTAGLAVSPVRLCHRAPPTAEAGAWLVLCPRQPGHQLNREEGREGS